MSTWKHRLSKINPETRTGICAECGPVRIRVKKIRIDKSIQWKCGKGARRWDSYGKYSFAYHIKYRYGITEREYLKLFLSQKGRCAICKIKTEKLLHVDHDHATKKIRGLLCSRCNVAIGFLDNDPERCLLASKYLLASDTRREIK